MELSKVVASLAILLGVMLAGGYARGDGPSGPAVKETVHERLVAREAMQRAALAEHHRRKEDVARLCNRPLNGPAELEACRAAYRRL
ncbi:MAG TPA: hypothetical protein VGP97_14605 [Burkholderiales bacterium]|jgi:hypothetical protein|nr:hypothetical protein [Burkholderiales bacterium]